MLSNEHVDGHASLHAAGWSFHVWTTAIDDLVSRGILGSDPMSGIGMKDDHWEWTRSFRFAPTSSGFADLIQKARNYIRDGSILL